MVKCPFCQFDNEDGALFCEQCKSDLGGMAESVSPPMAEPLTEPLAAAPIETVPEPGMEPAMPAAEAVTAPPAPVAEATAPMPSPAEAAALAQPAPAAGALAADAKPRLAVIRGVRIGVEYPIYEGENFIGRADEKPVDVDLEDQESPDRVWSSRQHACIIFQDGVLTIEDLNSSNGTFVNRTRVYPGQKRQLAANDVIQIGTVQMKVKL
jgi:hypothetical protein